jgi:splicing factor 3B subunit 2
VPRHWGRKRKYLQGKRGVEKPPFALPDFVIKTGICDVRDATHEDEAKQSAKQKNRARVSGRGGGGSTSITALCTRPSSSTRRSRRG